MFSYICWAAPTNTGMGVGVLTFDWEPLKGEFPISLLFFPRLFLYLVVDCFVFRWLWPLYIYCLRSLPIVSLQRWYLVFKVPCWVIFYWILAPIPYTMFPYSSPYQSYFFQALGSRLLLSNKSLPPFFFDKTYNVPHVLLPKDIFNETAYAFIPLYLSTMYAMTYLRKRILNDVEK